MMSGSSSADFRQDNSVRDTPSSDGAHLASLDTTNSDPAVLVDLEASPGTLPGVRLISPNTSSSESRHDLIARGIVSVEKAESYCLAYQGLLDHFLYGIVGPYGEGVAGMVNIRSTNTALFTAVCTVGALHLVSSDFERLRSDFVTMSTELGLTKRSSRHDVLALCIGAFWLDELSWALVGIAVRLALELQLYRGFSKALAGDYEQYLNIRTYFLVYICDHHFSIPYGRPPMTRECEAVRNARKLLDCTHSTEEDIRLVSQVLRWSICTDAYESLGGNADRELSDAEIHQMRRLNVALDGLHAEWAGRLTTHFHVGNYPRKAANLQYHFAKLYVGSFAFRALRSDTSGRRLLGEGKDISDLSSLAISSATSVLRIVVSDSELTSYLHGLPAYFHTMITFAIVFLLRLLTRCSITPLQLDMQEAQQLLFDLVGILRRATSVMHPHHPLVHITKGLNDVLEKDGVIARPSIDATVPMNGGDDEVLLQPPMLQGDPNFLDDESFNQMWMTGFG